MRYIGMGVCLAGLLLAGCATDLDVRKLEASQPRVGVGYVLPYTQYKAKITWRVAECVAPTDTELAKIKIVTKVELEDGQADDAAHAYVIDPTQLQSLLSISAFQAKWQDGRNLFSTINISAEDRTAQVIAKTAAGVGKLALALAAGGDPGVGPKPQACTPDVIKAVKDAEDQKAALEILSTKVKGAQARVKTATDKVAAMGVNASDEAKKELGDAIDALNTAMVAQVKGTAALAETLETITVVRTAYWPEESGVFATATPYQLPDKTLDRWASLEENVQRPKIMGETQVHLQIARAGSFGMTPQQVAAGALRQPQTLPANVRRPARPTFSERPNEEGLRYRMPARGRVFACASTPCGEASTDIYTQLEGPIAQLGYVNVLPVRTRRFGSTTFAAEFTPGGALKSAGYEEKAAAAENVAGAFGDVVSAMTPLIDYQNGAAAREQAAELAELEFLKKKRDALAALEENPNAEMALGAQALDADTALINAQIANLNAQITLAETEAKMAKIGQ